MAKLRTLAQNNIIHGLLGNFGFDREAKAEMVLDITQGRTESSKEMTFDEANVMIKRLDGRPIFAARKAPRTEQLDRQIAGIKRIASAKHRNLMELKARRRGISPEGLGDLSASVNKGIRNPRTTEEVNRVIEAIKAMDKRGKRPNVVKQEAA